MSRRNRESRLLPSSLGRLAKITSFFRGDRGPIQEVPSSPPRVSIEHNPLRPTFHWGGVNYAWRLAKKLFLAVGSPRSGKSLTLKLLALSALIHRGHTKRMFFFDVKNEYFPWLQSIVPGHVALIDPFNPKGVAWDIAADCRSVDDCEAIAGLLAPVQDSKEPFFGESVRQWFQGAMVTLHITREGEWTFSEFVRELRSPKAIKKLLEEAPELNRSRIESYFETEKPNRDVLSTLGNRIADLAAVARKWENVREKVSISDWMRGRNPILVFGHSHRNVDAIAALARAFIHRLSQTLLDGENTDLPHSWVFLDEIQTLPKLTELPQLLSKGGSKGVAIAAGYQDIGAMREIYGADLAQSINSYFGFKAFFRTEDPDSAEWASKFFGEARFLVPLMGRSFTDGANPTSSWSVTEHLDKRRIVPPEAFMELPFLDPPEVNAIGSYVIAPVRGGRYPYELTLETIQRFFPEFVQSADPIPSDDELPFI